MNDELVCHARSSRKAALFWTTMAFFGGFAGVSAFGPIVSQLKAGLGLSPMMMGLLAASPALSGSLLRIPFGAAVDRTGGKRPILVLLVLAAVGIAGMTAMFRFFPDPRPAHYGAFLLCGVLCGCGIAVFSVGVPTVSYWYPQKRQGAALAVYAGLGNLAPGIFALLLPALVTSLGFTVSYVIWLAATLVLIAALGWRMQDAPYFQYREMGIEIEPDALLHACGQELLPSGNALSSLRKAAADGRTWILTGLYFVSFGGFIALTVWYPTYWAENFALSLVKAGGLTSLYAIGASFLRVLGGYGADRWGGERVTLVSFVLVGVGAVLTMAAGASLSIALAGQMLLAVGMGFANAAVFKLVPKYSPQAVGGAAGIVGGLGAFGGFVIPLLLGLFVKYDSAAGYARGFGVFVALSILAVGGIGLLLRQARSTTAALAAAD
ncbi:MAG: MFS transporter [Desulfobacteraceae bacterium]|jgi:NNP family nitrate/nitrite transporter-like MFS transporter|nr:MFS transporter [Desulfobacteraceae bacterium]